MRTAERQIENSVTFGSGIASHLCYDAFFESRDQGLVEGTERPARVLAQEILARTANVFEKLFEILSVYTMSSGERTTEWRS